MLIYKTIKRFIVVTVGCLSFVIFGGGCGQTGSPPLVILDTDLSSDVDDVGAVAVLHNLANQGKAEILAMMVSSGDPWSIPCLDAINTWFGRPDIPLGMIKGKSVRDESKYTRLIANEYPHDIQTGEEATDSVRLYRQILSAQVDKSVTLVSVGYLTNLHNLLLSEADSVSSMDGRSLVKRKVKTLVTMGGAYPKGYEWNFYKDSHATRNVVKSWPTPIVFSGYEIGKDVLTGAKLKNVQHYNPIRRSYELYNNLTDRPSWDQVTVFYAVENANKHNIEFWTIVDGQNNVQENGGNSWHGSKNDSFDHSYLVQQGSTDEIAELLEQLMLTIPQ